MNRGWRSSGLPRMTSLRLPRWRWRRTERINERRGPSLPNPLAAPDEVGSRPIARLWIIGAVFTLLFAFMGVRLAFLQIADHAAYASTIQANSLRTTAIAAPRGDILARSGLVLAANEVEQELALSRDDAANYPGLIGRVAALVHLPPKEVRTELQSVQYTDYQPVPIVTNTPKSVIVYLAEHASEFPGVTVQATTERAYPPGGEVASQVLGYVGPITAYEYQQVEKTGRYTENSQVGQSGIEQFYDQYLRGTDGYQEIEVDAEGDPIATVDNVLPKVGDSVVLNIDAPLQNFVTNALAAGIERDRAVEDPVSHRYPQAPNGAVVVLDPRNGHVLAMASFPTYNLKEWVGGISKRNYQNLQATGAMNNWATTGQYPPGSTFKLVTATAALNDHLIAADQYVDDTGKFTVPGCLEAAAGCTFYDDEKTGLGEVDLPLALTESSDYYFYNLGYMFWNEYTNNKSYPYGETPIQDEAAAYGLDAPTGIDLPYEASGIVDSPLGRREGARAVPEPVPLRRVVHGQQHRDGLRAGRHGHHAARARERLRDVRERRDALHARGRRRGGLPVGQGARALPAEDRRQGGPARVGARPDPPGAARRRERPERDGLRGVPSLRGVRPRLVPDRGQDGHGLDPRRRRAGQLVRRLRPGHLGALRGALRDRQGRLRRRRRRPGRRTDLRLPRAPPRRPAAPPGAHEDRDRPARRAPLTVGP